MSEKPTFSLTRGKRLEQARKELAHEELILPSNSNVQTTLVLKSSMLYAVKEIALKRKKLGIKPDTFNGIIRDLLDKFIKNEGKV